MTPHQFIDNWKKADFSERSSYQQHFLDLCTVLGQPTPPYPRVVPTGPDIAALLKKRTLTNLDNERLAWLANAHRAIDEAVAAAHDFPADLSDDDLFGRLLELNLSWAGSEGSGAAVVVEE